jgi:hypothetical protein
MNMLFFIPMILFRKALLISVSEKGQTDSIAFGSKHAPAVLPRSFYHAEILVTPAFESRTCAQGSNKNESNRELTA